MSRPTVNFQRTYVTPLTADLRKVYVRDTIVVDPTGAVADIPLLLPKIGTAYAPVGIRITVTKPSNALRAVEITPAATDAVTSDVPSAFPGFGIPGAVNSSALPAGQASSVTLEATDMSLTTSPQPNPSGGTPTTIGAWLAIGSGAGGGATGVISGTVNVLAKLTAPNAIGDSNISDDGLVIRLLGVGLSTRRVNTAVNYNVQPTDYVVRVTDTSIPRAITLPDPTVVGDGWLCVVKDYSDLPMGGAAANNITVTSDGAGLIDGAANAVVNTNLGALSFQCDGTGYAVIGRY